MASMITMCCVCGKVKNPETNVYETAAKSTMNGFPNYMISHGYCPKCMKEALAEVDLVDQAQKDAKINKMFASSLMSDFCFAFVLNGVMYNLVF